jgi:hypothetical protein
VIIGIVDTGIDSDSPEFAGRISNASRDVVATRGLDNPDSDHGTHVALVAAAGRNNTGVMGIAYNATIAMFRADSSGSCATENANDPDSGCSFFDSDIARGVDAAVAAGARVINLSLGGSAPEAVVRDAITRAATAGVVVIVSAGNDGGSTEPGIDPNNPDPFAVGLRAAGNGNVIIAGSVNENNLISSFANRAGAEANWYLNARGEDVCCTYENGTLKTVTNPDGSRSVFVFSGTSFSAPQIAGAAALLFQAFPNLTASQVVDLLLASARDAGASGTDAVYGRGILDLAAAFAPRGTTSLAGSTSAMPLTGAIISTSAPMGDAGQRTTGLQTLVLDSYGRAYGLNLAAGLTGARAEPKLAPALAGHHRNMSLAGERLSLAFAIDATGRVARLPWQGQLRLSPEDGEQARVLAARIVARLSPKARLGVAFAQGVDGLIAQVRERSGPAFLIAASPLASDGVRRSGEVAVALRHELGRWGLTLSGESGAALSGPGFADRAIAGGQLHRDRADRIGVALDRRLGQANLALGASWLNEQRTVLGARLHGALGADGADSLFLDANGEWRVGAKWRLAAGWRQGLTWARAGAALAPGSRLLSSAWSLDLAREGVLQGGDWIGLRLSQPLRVEAGGLRFDLPVAYDYATLTPEYALRELRLAPHGRELDAELVWRGTVLDGAAVASLFYRRHPGHVASRPADAGLALSWSRQF